MPTLRVKLVVQQIDTTKPVGEDADGDPVEVEVGLVVAPTVTEANHLIGHMLDDTAWEFRHFGEEGDRG